MKVNSRFCSEKDKVLQNFNFKNEIIKIILRNLYPTLSFKKNIMSLKKHYISESTPTIKRIRSLFLFSTPEGYQIINEMRKEKCKIVINDEILSFWES